MRSGDEKRILFFIWRVFIYFPSCRLRPYNDRIWPTPASPPQPNQRSCVIKPGVSSGSGRSSSILFLFQFLHPILHHHADQHQISRCCRFRLSMISKAIEEEKCICITRQSLFDVTKHTRRLTAKWQRENFTWMNTTGLQTTQPCSDQSFHLALLVLAESRFASRSEERHRRPDFDVRA